MINLNSRYFIFVLYYKKKLFASMQRTTSYITLKRIKLLWVLSLTRKEELVIKTIHSVHQQKSCNNDKGTVFFYFFSTSQTHAYIISIGQSIFHSKSMLRHQPKGTYNNFFWCKNNKLWGLIEETTDIVNHH